MRVVLLEGVFADPRNDTGLIRILLSGYDERHDVAIAPPHSEIFEQWLSAQGGSIKDAIRLATATGLQNHVSSTPGLVVTVQPNGAETFNPRSTFVSVESAVRLLEQPLRILVENDIADAHFLTAFLPADARSRFEKFVAARWVEFQHCGGITSLSERVRILKGSPADQIRAFVLFDSDGLIPGQISQHANEARSECQGSVPFHMLSGRAIENYLTTPALEAWAFSGSASAQRRNKPKARAFGRLTADQKRHFNMKRGFDGDRDHADSATVGSFYASVSVQDRTTLENGFGRSIAELFDATRHPAGRSGWFDVHVHAPELVPAYRELLNLF
jgi:hypothetical protein